MNFESWLIFSFIAFVATVTPGPAILLVSTHSAAYGLKKAVITIFGNVSGLLIMSALSVAGLSSILLYSTTVFIAIKFVGAAYLIYLGIRLWRFGFSNKSDVNTELSNYKAISSTSLYVQGLFVALSNPKAIVFTTALFPQFIDASLPLTIQFSILVSTFMLLSFSCLLMYGFTARNLNKSKIAKKASNFLGKAFGTAFIASGLVLASASQKQA